MDYYDYYNIMPEGWHTAKELGVNSQALNAMERRGLVYADRSHSPIKWMPKENGLLEQIIELLEMYNYHDGAFALVHNTAIVTTLVYRDGRWIDYRGHRLLRVAPVINIYHYYRGQTETIK